MVVDEVHGIDSEVADISSREIKYSNLNKLGTNIHRMKNIIKDREGPSKILGSDS